MNKDQKKIYNKLLPIVFPRTPKKPKEPMDDMKQQCNTKLAKKMRSNRSANKKPYISLAESVKDARESILKKHPECKKYFK